MPHTTINFELEAYIETAKNPQITDGTLQSFKRTHSLY